MPEPSAGTRLAVSPVPPARRPVTAPAAPVPLHPLAAIQRRYAAAIQRAAGCGCSRGASRCSCHDDELAIQRAPIQTRLEITPPGDEYEQEAERTADLVMRMPAGPEAAQAPAVAPSIRPYIQRRALAPARETTGPVLEDRLAAEAPNGVPIHASVRIPMEARFGVDFSGVRVHTGHAAAALSDALDAQAFTHGRDVYFARGMYAPGSAAGQRLLAHELTHVVQQGGGSGAPAIQQRRGALQRAPNVERKWYYFGLTGKTVHEEVEGRLLADKANSSLIVEAPIPGGTRDKRFEVSDPDNFDRVGRADLYTSSESASGAVIGVRGQHDKAELSKAPAHRKREYHNLRTGGVRTAKGRAKWTPQVTGNRIRGSFPTLFKVADLKPLAVTKAGEGRVQIANYIDGLTQFALQAKNDGALSQSGSIRGEPLNDLHIPAGLDYWQLDNEPPNRPGPGSFIVGNKRYWVAAGSDSGLYYYFWLDHPAPSRQARERQERVLTALEPVRRALLFPEPGPGRTVQLTRRPRARRLAPLAAASGTAAPRTVQRQPSPTRPKRDWAKEAADWEARRAAWDKDSAKPFLKTADAKAIERRADAEKHLKGGSSSSFAPVAKGLRSIELWQGLTGKGLGKLRFLLGGTFDKVVGFYERIRERFTGWHKKLHGVNETGLSVGWKRKLVRALLGALKMAFAELLRSLFAFFADCIQGLLSKVVRQFTEEISEELHKRVEELHRKFEEFSTKFREEFESRFGSWDQLIADLSSITKWGQIAADLVTLIRLGVQAISCLSPPALGCLWGLVAQLAIDSALNLVMGTRWFENRIVRPTVRNLIKRFAGPAYQNLLDGALRLVKLDDFAANVTACHREKDSEALTTQVMRSIPVTGVDGQDLIKKRDQWYRDEAGEVARAKKAMGSKGMAAEQGESEEREKEEVERAQKKVREDIGWPDQRKLDEAWEVFDHKRPDMVNDDGQPVSGGDLVILADEAARQGLERKQVEEAIERAPKGADGKRMVGEIRKQMTGGSPKREPRSRPPRDIPDELFIRKRYVLPPLPREIGPQVFPPSPGQPEKEPSVLPGVKLEF